MTKNRLAIVLALMWLGMIAFAIINPVLFEDGSMRLLDSISVCIYPSWGCAG